MLTYISRKPQVSTGSAPVLIVLHGYGADEHDLLPIAESLPLDFHIISMQAPIPLPWGGYSWYHLTQTTTGAIRGDDESRRESESLLVGDLAGIISAEGADPENVSFMGFSQGAAMIYALLARHDLTGMGIHLRRAICMSGYIPRDCDLSGKDYTNLKIFMSHGEYDELIAPIALDEAARILKKTGANVTAKSYPIGHGVSEETIADITAWLGA